ncbi:hypothetical protein ACFX5U_12470 [Sphingobacterium sp. SG20118]|uniref:hypothetical protein n=1 Tax=Sphingobacterium sp. SG20118 TaxID=3367156 RepID=UPI0037DFC7B5
MEIKINNIPDSDYSSNYYSIHSNQKLDSEFGTNVLTSNIPISKLLINRDILLVDDLKGDSRWGMNKIIQRNISANRVKEIKTEYLEAENRTIKFFPAITVVLLPKTNGEPSQQFNQSQSGFDSIAGIEITKTYPGENYIYDLPVNLKWDKQQISALVIDGQHRVSAIREFYKGRSEITYKNVSIPVSFVIFKNDIAIDLIQATRTLFIDVNNTPRLVSEEKLIFIDDRNIHRRITSKSLGSNDPGNNNEDVYQKMLQCDDFLLSDNSFINRYLIEESGKDDEESRGFLSNHKSLFPWEISNIMTIHKNILGNILLKYKNVDKTRDIRSVCLELNGVILEDIDSAESVEEFSLKEKKSFLERLANSGLLDSEIDIFKKLIQIKSKNVEEIQQAEGEFFTGTISTHEEDKDRSDFINLLLNIYNQDCTKDSSFEASAIKITELLKGKTSIFVNILTQVFNNIWFTQSIKESILSYTGEERKLIFNFILNTHESLKVESNIRRRTDKVEKQIHTFIDQNEEKSLHRKTVLSEWAGKLEEDQKNNLLRTVVGQEMLFLFIIDQAEKLNTINLNKIITFINSLGNVKFFNNDYSLSLKFFDYRDFEVTDFNQWSDILLKGESMKPGLTNALKGANLISIIQKGVTNRTSAGANLTTINKLQKSYGQAIEEKLTNYNPQKLFKMYQVAQNGENLDFYITQGEIDTLKENFTSPENITLKAKNVIIKLYGGIALEQVVNHFKNQI